MEKLKKPDGLVESVSKAIIEGITECRTKYSGS